MCHVMLLYTYSVRKERTTAKIDHLFNVFYRQHFLNL